MSEGIWGHGPDPLKADAHGWLPIETVPKDGTPIWLYGSGIYHGIEFVGRRRGAQYPGDTPHWWNLHTRQRVDDHLVTHWVLRPPPPEET